MRARGRGLAAVIAVLGAIAVVLSVTVVVVSWRYWARRQGGLGAWTTAALCAGWAGVLVAQSIGLWLWWRAPRNATGRWLWLAGLCWGLFLVGFYWPSRWGMQLGWAGLGVHAALGMAFLGWPTGQPDGVTRRWVLSVTAAAATSAVVLNLFTHDKPPPGWPRDPLAPFHGGWVSITLLSAQAWTFSFIPAAAVAVILVRRRRRLPTSARRLLTPITIAVVVVAAFDVFNLVISDLGAELTWDAHNVHFTLLGAVNLAQQYAQVGVATVGLAIAFGLRQRAVQGSNRWLELDLGRAAPVAAPTAALKRLIGDPSARVLYLRPDRTWVDAEGHAAEVGLGHRSATYVVGQDGESHAIIETDAGVDAHPILIEMAAATIATRLANEHVAAVAKARLEEVAALQLALLDATDQARRRVERDLHDGAQQRLVGVTLAARLASRATAPEALNSIRSEITRVKGELVELVNGIAPVVLSNGLAAALATLAAMTPLDVTIRVRGDLDSTDPLARTLWFIACEAAANAVKHAGGSALQIELAVDATTASLRIADDGCGGVGIPPRAISARMEEGGAAIHWSSPPQIGTSLTAVFERRTSREVA
ncbi:MAG: sensor histidine kinase [Acidimicrobiales bacterium]